MSKRRLLSWSQNNILWLLQQPRRRLQCRAPRSWHVTAPITGAVRRTTFVPAACADSMLARGLVEPTGQVRRLFRISAKGLEAYRTGGFIL